MLKSVGLRGKPKYTFSYSRVRKKDINIDNRKRNTIYF